LQRSDFNDRWSDSRHLAGRPFSEWRSLKRACWCDSKGRESGRRNRSRVVQRLPFNQSQYRPRNPHSCLGLWQTQASTFKDAGGKFLRTIEEQTGIVKVRKYHCRGLIIDADGFSHWASKGTNPRAISRRPRKAKAGVTYIYSAPLLSLTLTMFGQALSSRPENPFSFPTRDSDGVVSDQPCPSAMRPLLLRIRMGPHVF